VIAATAGAVLGELAALQQVVVRPCHGIFLTECNGAPFELQTVSVVYMGAAASAPSPSYRKELMAALAEEPGRLDLVVRFHAVTGGLAGLRQVQEIAQAPTTEACIATNLRSLDSLTKLHEELVLTVTLHPEGPAQAQHRVGGQRLDCQAPACPPYRFGPSPHRLCYWCPSGQLPP